MSRLEDYKTLVGQEAIDELRALGVQLRGRRLKMVNSTMVGGGVAEMLHRLIPLFNEVGVRAEWQVIEGTQDFFGVTKKLHRALQGDDVEPLTARERDLFIRVNRANAARLISGDEDFVVIHDPQPIGLVDARHKAPASRWIWRCHIDVSRPQPQPWAFLRPLMERFDAAIFSSESFRHSISVPQHVIHPAIDPLSDKNRELPAATIESVYARMGVPRDKPVVIQVSRFDALKDPVGVVRAFRLAHAHLACRLVLAGGRADDDPEAAAVLADVHREVDGDPDIHILADRVYDDLEVNALVRGASLVVQKSLREGFGLTVAEALWKRKPVIASSVGGLPLQVIHDSTGVLVGSVEETGAAIHALLQDPHRMQRLGEAGHRHVRQNLLITSNLARWLHLLLAQGQARGSPAARRAR
jgi:trehalose synthase